MVLNGFNNKWQFNGPVRYDVRMPRRHGLLFQAELKIISPRISHWSQRDKYYWCRQRTKTTSPSFKFVVQLTKYLVQLNIVRIRKDIVMGDRGHETNASCLRLFLELHKLSIQNKNVRCQFFKAREPNIMVTLFDHRHYVLICTVS